jgi:hypothetical protein
MMRPDHDMLARLGILLGIALVAAAILRNTIVALIAHAG